MPETTQNASPDRPSKAAYRAPVLTVFGSLADLTANVGSKSKLDGGGSTMMRSQ